MKQVDAFAPSAAADPASPGKPLILVVDDDASINKMLRVLLDANGFEVIVAADGSAAIEATLRRNFDVVLTDIHMPGMNGIELLRSIRKYDLDVPVILMTAAPSIETAVDAVALGALQYLSKPVPSAELLNAVTRAARLRRMAQMKRDAFKLLGSESVHPSDRAGLEASLDRALQTMWMAFQPIVDSRRNRVFGFEALMRAKESSLPHPGAILSAAERLGRLSEVGRRVRNLAAEAFERAPVDALLFVNLHTSDLLDDALYERHAPLSRMADRVVMEITERSTIDSVKDVKARVSTLRQLGFRIAVDDLGAGYAGLSSFAALEPEIVKLDMSLVRDVHQSDIRQRLIASMTSLCREMGMQVVAEGVEVVEERETVRAVGCELLQGYLFAKPGPPFPGAERIV